MHYCPNIKTADSGEKVQWHRIKWIQVRKESPESLFVNYSFAEVNFLQVRVTTTTRKRLRLSQTWPDDIPRRYEEKQPITVAKKRDLLSLCTSGLIPEDHHAYYNNLSTTTTKSKANEMEREVESEDE